MQLLTLENLSVTYGETTILECLNAEIEAGDRIAIVGANGAGKSTLLSLLANQITPSSGAIHWHHKVPSASYFKQEQESVRAVEWEETEAMIYRKKWSVPTDVRYEKASGGERMKIRLSAALASKARLLLLDEPTNHLDSTSVDQLVEIIKSKSATCIIVSHDRYFIDQVADYVFELEYGKLTVYKGNYTSYRAQKEENQRTHQMHYEQQQREIRRVEEQVDQLSGWSAKAHAESTKKAGTKEYFRKKAKKRDVQIRSKRKRLEAELNKNRIEKPKEEIHVSFDVKGRTKKGKRVFELKDVQKRFKNRVLLKDVSFTVQAGERLALVGPNGVGKSTLFKMLLGEEDYDGQLWKTEGMTIGYLSQTVLDLPENKTMEDYFYSTTFEEQGLIRINLTNLGFSHKQWTLPFSHLSMGERVKVKLMQFILEGTDVLLLDEPTNHLDLPSREALERTLETFPGTLLFASHDRYFTERMSDDVLLFDGKTIQKMYMPYDKWQASTEVENDGKREEEKLRLETALQAALGKLSLLSPGDKEYIKLDEEFKSLTKRLNALK